MVALPQAFLTAEIRPSGEGNVLIENGLYKTVVVATELKQTSTGTGTMLVAKIIITEGKYMNTEFIRRFNIVNESAKAVEIAFSELLSLSQAVGLETRPSDSVQLHNKPFISDIKSEKQEDWTDKKTGITYDGKAKSEIKRFRKLPITGIQQVTVTPTTTQVAVAHEAAEVTPVPNAAVDQTVPW